MMKHEYHEGPKIGENFKKLATALHQNPKTIVPPKVGNFRGSENTANSPTAS